MHYSELLQSLGRKPGEMGASIQQKIKQYLRLKKNIDKAKIDLEKAKTESKRESLQEEIDEAEVTLDSFNDTLCDAINKYNSNFEKNKQKGNKLNQAKGKANTSSTLPATKKEGGSTEGGATEGTPPAASEPGNEPSNNPDENVPPAGEPVKKKNSFGLVGGILLFALAAVVGVGIYESNKS